ncbi:MAG: alkene reductase, partial [Cycloclasticus sp.]|nr:alkene reductase [Cycloclasticus sp.]
DWFTPKLKAAFGGIYIANQGFTKETASEVLKAKEADAVAFGQLYIANPDLPYRFQTNAPLNKPDATTFYAPTSKGYTDYPFIAEAT